MTTARPRPPRPPAPFPPVDYAEWRARTEEELGDRDFARTLVTRNASGIEVQPLYTAPVPPVDDPAGFPGLWPATRGAVAAGREGAWTMFVAGEERPRADPLGELARTGSVAGGLDAAFEALASLVVQAVPDGHPLEASTVPYHGAGATAVQELACALSTALEYLRALEHEGIEVATAASRIALRFAIGRDVFAEIAKLRAARALWSRVLAACGAPEAPPLWIHAETSPRTLTCRDPWTNILRVTTQTFAAICGGADAITTSPFDAALGLPEEQGRRLARNTQLILAEESHVGRVVDPAGGSWYVEQLTEQLARAAWAELRSLERVGGMVKALLDGEVHRRLEESWTARRSAIAHRRIPVTGVSEFPTDEPLLVRRTRTADVLGTRLIDPLPQHRDAAPFEELRDAAEELAPRPVVFLALLGSPAAHSARAAFARNLFAAGGFHVVEGEGTGDADPAAAAARLTADAGTSGAVLACLCGADAHYASHAPSAARALRGAGMRRVLLAGKAGEREAELRDAGVDDFLFLGMDALALLSTLLEPCGAPAAEDAR